MSNSGPGHHQFEDGYKIGNDYLIEQQQANQEDGESAHHPFNFLKARSKSTPKTRNYLNYLNQNNPFVPKPNKEQELILKKTQVRL